ncbi:30S ribosomal protein S6 [Myxosarcina sp. GI1]|uniref:30S ribosomal protein S6 n=1 Tax=Myxosarcina sp. GI1 TaxID=1541065 RepID=UPI0005650D71|nr:30S ribosomal protein S6 [Myxosarcina sp. GI1]
MNNYEIMYILRPDLSEEQVGETTNKYQSFLSENGAESIEIDIKGKRRLAYPIGKYLDGIYVIKNFQADGSQIATLERMMRLSDDVIRYLSLKLKPASVVEATEAESEPVAEETEVSV